MNSEKIYWNRISAIVLALLMIAASAGFLTFQILKIYQTNKELEVQEAFLVSAGSVFNNIPDKEDLLKIQRELDYIEEIMPVEESNIDILDYFEMAAVESNVYIRSIGFEENQVEDEYIQRPVHITVEGKYKDLLTYITELRNGMRPFKVSEIKMGRTEQSEEILNCELLIYVLYQNPTEPR